MAEIPAERGLCIGNTYFRHKTVHRYNRVAKGKEKNESLGLRVDKGRYAEE